MKLEALIDDALTRDRLLSEKRGPEPG